MEAEKEATRVTAHIKDPIKREKVKAALIKTLTDADQVKSWLDDDAYSNAPGDYRYDDSDGVTPITPSQLEDRQDAKRVELRAQSRSFFSDDDLNERADLEAVGASVMVAEDTDVNRRLKFGFRPLHIAAIAGDHKECLALLEAGADKKAKDNSQMLAWQRAQMKGHTKLAKILRP